MYEIGSFLVYGNKGVCKVEDITTADKLIALKNIEKDKERLYYVLKPVYQGGIIYTPIDHSRISMRPVISEEEAKRLIDLIPSMHAENFSGKNTIELKAYYQEVTNNPDCEELLQLTMSIYAKKQHALAQKRRFGQVDERYMKQAESLLFGELAVALGIERDQVQEFIYERVHALME